MKKIFLSILIVLCLTGCKTIEKNITPEPTKKTTENDVVITIPGSFFEFREVKYFLDSESTKGNIKNFETNPDGSVTYTLTTEQYDAVL